MHKSHLTPIALNSLTKWSGKTSLANGGRFLRNMSLVMKQARLKKSNMLAIFSRLVSTLGSPLWRFWSEIQHYAHCQWATSLNEANGDAVSHSNCQFKQITKIKYPFPVFWNLAARASWMLVNMKVVYTAIGSFYRLLPLMALSKQCPSTLSSLNGCSN